MGLQSGGWWFENEQGAGTRAALDDPGQWRQFGGPDLSLISMVLRAVLASSLP